MTHTMHEPTAVFGPACTTCGDDGDCPDCDPIQPDAVTAKLAQALANTTRVPTYVVQQGAQFLIQDDDDLSVYFASVEPATIVARYQPAGAGCTCGGVPTITVAHNDGITDPVCQTCFDAYYAPTPVAQRHWTYQPAVAPPGFPDDDDDSPDGGGPPRAFPICRACHTNAYPPSGMQPAFCSECVNAMLHGLDNRFSASAFAQTRQSQAIEAKLSVCRNCQGVHQTWRCPEIARVLFAPPGPEPWKDIALGRELCRMKWRDFKAFVALLLSVPADALIVYAASYQAFIRAYRPDSDLTINEVLQAWAKDMARGGAENERQVAA